MAINSRSKGNKAEREVAKLFKEWTNKDFARTPSSGGLQWKSTNSKGDIVCTTEGHYFPFCIEVKFHKDINFAHLLLPGIKNVKVFEFWNQCQRDATKAGKIPMLIMRYNGMPSDFYFLVLPRDFYMILLKNELMYTEAQISYISRDHKFFIIRSTDFFRTNYKEIKKLAKTFLKNGSK